MKKIVFMGSKEIGYYCLAYLIENKDSLDAEVTALLTNEKRLDKSANLVELARANGIAIIPGPGKFLETGDCDIIISAQYHLILKKEHIAKARQIAVNLHMAPLPEYRGCNQFSLAIINGDKEFGTTFHKLEEGIDSGPILFEERFKIPKNIFVKELFDITTEKSKKLFRENIKHIVEGNYKLTPQKKFFRSRKHSFHLRKEIDALKKIDPDWSAEKIFRYFRATYMPGFPPPYFEINNTKVYLTLEADKNKKDRSA